MTATISLLPIRKRAEGIGACKMHDDNVVILPVIRIDEPAAGPIYAVPTLADQAQAVTGAIEAAQLLGGKLPLSAFGDVQQFIDRLTAAAATLRRLAGEGE